jgi:hypothetical protein
VYIISSPFFAHWTICTADRVKTSPKHKIRINKKECLTLLLLQKSRRNQEKSLKKSEKKLKKHWTDARTIKPYLKAKPGFPACYIAI